MVAHSWASDEMKMDGRASMLMRMPGCIFKLYYERFMRVVNLDSQMFGQDESMMSLRSFGNMLVNRLRRK